MTDTDKLNESATKPATAPTTAPAPGVNLQFGKRTASAPEPAQTGKPVEAPADGVQPGRPGNDSSTDGVSPADPKAKDKEFQPEGAHIQEVSEQELTGKRPAHPADIDASHFADKSEPEESRVAYSSTARNLHLGDYIFENGSLNLSVDQANHFDHVLSQQPPQIRNMVTKIDVSAADELIAKHRATDGSMRAGIDTTANTIGPQV